MRKAEAVANDFLAFRCHQKQDVIIRHDLMKRLQEWSLVDLKGSSEFRCERELPHRRP